MHVRVVQGGVAFRKAFTVFTPKKATLRYCTPPESIVIESMGRYWESKVPGSVSGHQGIIQYPSPGVKLVGLDELLWVHCPSC